jgi:hypothetical protein
VETSSDSSFTSQAQALPRAALGEGRFLSLAAGRFVSSDSAREAVVSETLLDSLGAAVPKAALDQSLVLTTRSASVDSGLAAMVEGLGSMGDVMGRVRLDSLEEPGYRRRALRREMGQSLGDFLEGYQQRPAEHRDTLRVVGVLEREGAFAGILPPLLVPPAVAERLSRGGDPSDPSALLAAMQEGTLFELGDEALEGSYRKITLELHDPVQHAAVLDSLEELGLRSFSFAAQFKDISRAFALMNLGMGLIGFIALFVAALGIVNTLVMAIVERRREIGVLKALGASEGEIRAVFLAESGAIGLLGGLLGIAAGWVVIRVGVAVGTAWLESMGEVGMAGFTFGLTPTLTALALLFGVGVSLAAGLYPAARAARLDPVAALRAE